jgi:flagellar basal-body rod protein FlgF
MWPLAEASRRRLVQAQRHSWNLRAASVSADREKRHRREIDGNFAAPSKKCRKRKLGRLGLGALSLESVIFRMVVRLLLSPAKRHNMDPLTTAAANGLQASMDSIDMLANNMANASTGGFKADREFYSTYLAPEIDGSQAAVGESPVVQRQWTDFSQGTLVPTGNPTDLALSGSGFFVVNGPKGPLYTRNGNFQVSASGVLMTSEGYPVTAAGGKPLTANSGGPISIASDGSVSQDGNLVGQLQLVDFSDSSRLSRATGPYFQNQDPQSNPVQVSQADVYQGKVESSNAQPAESAARMVLLLRHYEMLQRAIRVGSEMNQQAVQEVARVGS